MVEQRFRKARVVSSILTVGSILYFEYSSSLNLVRGMKIPVWLLMDPVEDNPDLPSVIVQGANGLHRELAPAASIRRIEANAGDGLAGPKGMPTDVKDIIIEIRAGLERQTNRRGKDQ